MRYSHPKMVGEMKERRNISEKEDLSFVEHHGQFQFSIQEHNITQFRS